MQASQLAFEQPGDNRIQVRHSSPPANHGSGIVIMAQLSPVRREASSHDPYVEILVKFGYHAEFEQATADHRSPSGRADQP